MEQHDYIVLLEKFFKKEASSEERRILIEWIRKPGIRDEYLFALRADVERSSCRNR